MKKSRIKIGAAILEKRLDTLKAKEKEVRGIVDFIQIDICDGRFVPSKTFGSSALPSSFKSIAKLTTKDILELDMMVELDIHFASWIRAIKLANPKRVIFHYGSTKRLDEVFKALKGKKIKIGLAVHLHHKNTDILKTLNMYPFSYVQVMGIEKVGFGGQKFSNKTYAKIQTLKRLRPDLDFAVDGGVKVENAHKLTQAGATHLSSGSGLFKYKDGIKEAVCLMRMY